MLVGGYGANNVFVRAVNPARAPCFQVYAVDKDRPLEQFRYSVVRRWQMRPNSCQINISKRAWTVGGDSVLRSGRSEWYTRYRARWSLYESNPP